MNTLLIIGFIFIGVLTGLYMLLSIILHWALIILLFIYLLYRLVMLICHVLVYPGSFKLYQRMHQNAFALHLAKQSTKCIEQLHRIMVSVMTQQKSQRSPDHSIQAILNWFDSQYQVFQLMHEKQQLTHHQIGYYNLLFNINNLLNQHISEMPIREAIFVLNKMRDQNQQMIQQSQQPLEQICKQLHQLMVMLDVYTNSTTYWRQYQLWMNVDLLGTLNYMRCKILNTTNSKRVLLKVNNSELDCLYIINNDDSNATTVLFCNPNGAYYEYLYFDSNWFEFYRHLRWNVIMWNYRSYGYSTGSCSPSASQNDGIAIAQYFKHNYKLSKFGVHGYSLGGSIASYVALHMNLDFLIVDRAFNSIGQIASKSISPYIRSAFSILTNWDQCNYLDYWNYKGHKLIISDPMDEIIPFLAQIPVAVAQQQLQPCNKMTRIDSILDKQQVEYKQYFNQNIIPTTQLTSLVQSIIRLCRISQRIIKNNDQGESTEQDTLNNESEQSTQISQFQVNQTNYHTTIPDSYLMTLFPLMEQVQYSLHHLECVGTNLTIIVSQSSKYAEEVLQGFFACFYMFNQDAAILMQQFQTNVMKVLESRWQISYEDYILQDLQNIQSKVSKIDFGFRQQFDETLNQTIELTQSFQENINIRICNLGYMVPISCGHNSNLSIDELSEVTKFLVASQLCN